VSLAPILVIAGTLFWTNVGKGFSASQAFSILSIIMLVSQPFNMLMMSVPIFWSIVGCFARVQDFLLLPELAEQRSLAINIRPSDDRTSSSKLGSTDHSYELQQVDRTRKESDIRILGASFAFESSSEPLLKDVSLDIPSSSFAVVLGGVGSGKSTLLRAILGEVQISQGEIYVSQPSIAYCGQTSWLRNVSIRENVLGEEAFDLAFYNTVMDACVLNDDIKEFPQGDATLAGAGGTSLSGGQKQRVVGLIMQSSSNVNLTAFRPWQEQCIPGKESCCSTTFSVL